MQTRYLWLQERVSAKEVAVEKVKSDKNVSDMLTKVLSAPLREKHLETMNVINVDKHKSQFNT